MIPANHHVTGEQHADEQCGGSSQDSDTRSDSGLGYSSAPAPTNPDSESSASGPDAQTAGPKEAQPR